MEPKINTNEKCYVCEQWNHALKDLSGGKTEECETLLMLETPAQFTLSISYNVSGMKKFPEAHSAKSEQESIQRRSKTKLTSCDIETETTTHTRLSAHTHSYIHAHTCFGDLYFVCWRHEGAFQVCSSLCVWVKQPYLFSSCGTWGTRGTS